MKKVLLTLCAIVVALASQAQLMSVFHEVEYTSDGTIPGYPVGFSTYRIYASLADGTDALSAVFAANNDLLLMGSDTDDMWNTSFGGITGPDINAAFIGFFPEIAYDSMVTIGRENSATPGGAITAVVTDPGGAFDTALGAAAVSGADLVLVDGTWFTTPDQVNALGTGTDFRVLLGQVTCSGDVEYQLNVQMNDGGVGGAVLQYVWNQDAVDPNQTLECLLQYPADPTCGGPAPVDGCMDATACNYDVEATNDDGSCVFATGCDTCSGETDGTGTVVDNPEVGESCDDGDATTMMDTVQSDCTCAGTPIVEGCTDAGACNYNPAANQDDGSCEFTSCAGCTDAGACNYDATATIDDGSCDFLSCAGCTDDTACNYDASATIDDGSCESTSCAGCTDAAACNYDPTATIDDGSCEFTSCAGCTDSGACNYDATATLDDGSCEFTSCAGCTDAAACNYDMAATIDDGSCVSATGCDTCSGETDGTGVVIDNPEVGEACDDGLASTIDDTVQPDCSCLGIGAVPGCTDAAACNYNPAANQDDGSCEFTSCAGCTDATACNYDASATIDDGSCESTSCAGCTDAAACNYDPTATIDDGSCDLPDGCTDATACNYDAAASCDDGSCEFTSCAGCTDATACNYDPTATIDDGSCDLPDGCTDATACNYDAAASCDDGSCEYTSCAGCTDAAACNYDPTATIDDGSCDLPDGCTDAGACNYDASASCDDGSCEYVSCAGCTDVAACNYDATATINDGSCAFPGDACDDGDANTINDTYQADCGCVGTLVGGGPATPLALTPLGTCASLTGDVSGGDVSFEIVPATPGVRIEVSTTDFDAVVTILDGVGTVVSSINVGGLGDEYLNVGNLTAGDTYEVVVSSASGAGAFGICGQILPDTRADYDEGPYDLCDIYKADYVAADDYRFRFQLGDVDQTSYTNGVANTLLVLNNVPLLDLDTEYNVQIDAGFELSLADGSTELVWVMADEDNAFITLPQPVTQMRTIDNCANHGPHFLGDYIRATPWVCGSSDWEWSFVRTDITEFEILKLRGSTNRWLRLSSVAGLVPGATYDVKCRPIYPNGTPTTFGPVECMTIVGPAPGEAADGPVVEDEEVLDRMDIEPTAAIYPNPNNGEFMNVNLTGVEGKVTVDIINGMGAMVRSMEMTVAGDNVNEVIALNGIASGVYMVNITVNNTVITERLVVQK